MRVQAINNVESHNFCKQQSAWTKSLTVSSICKTKNDELSHVPNMSFRGVKGGVKGGVIGAAAALTLAALAGPFGLAVLPLWTTAGAIGGHTYEEENKPDGKINNEQ